MEYDISHYDVPSLSSLPLWLSSLFFAAFVFLPSFISHLLIHKNTASTIHNQSPLRLFTHTARPRLSSSSRSHYLPLSVFFLWAKHASKQKQKQMILHSNRHISRYLCLLSIATFLANTSWSIVGSADATIGCSHYKGGSACPAEAPCCQSGWCSNAQSFCSLALGCQPENSHNSNTCLPLPECVSFTEVNHNDALVDRDDVRGTGWAIDYNPYLLFFSLYFFCWSEYPKKTLTKWFFFPLFSPIADANPCTFVRTSIR